MIRGVFNVLLFAVLALITVEVHLQSVVFACAQEEVTAEIEADEPTCSLDPTSSKSDCATADPDTASDVPSHNTGEDLTRHVISLTDDTFDQLTSTATPATWLIMFKTNSCAICKKAMPVLRDLSVDVDIVSHNDRELEALSKGQLQHQRKQTLMARRKDQFMSTNNPQKKGVSQQVLFMLPQSMLAGLEKI